MRTAVVRLDLDPQRALSPEQVTAGLAELNRRGLVVHRQTDEGRLELILQSTDPDDARRRVQEACTAAVGTAPTVETVSFISRGTDEDALGVVQAFGATARLVRLEEDGEEVAVITLPATQRRRIPESRLHTALEAALNCEIRLVFE